MGLIGVGALSSFKTLTDIAQSFLQVRDTALIQGKVVELQAAIIAAQNETMAIQAAHAPLLARIDELEKEIVRLKDWETEKQRYELKRLDGGGLAYTLKGEVKSSEAAHWLCANCYQNGRPSILQPVPRGMVHARAGVAAKLECPACKSVVAA